MIAAPIQPSLSQGAKLTSQIDRILTHEPQAIAWTRKVAPEFVSYAEDAFDVMCDAVQGYQGSMTLFRGAWVHTRKMAGLAVLSALRQHRVESAQNLRQVIEMTSLFGYVAIHPKIEGGWGKPNATQAEVLASNKQYRTNAFKWIEKAYPEISESLTFFKDHINRNQAHGTILNSGHVYDYKDASASDQRFFDVPDADEIQLGMMMTGQIITTTLVMLHRVSHNTPIIIRPDLKDSIVTLNERAEVCRTLLAHSYNKG